MTKILLTGGSGLLGQELQKYIKCFAPSHRELDITQIEILEGDFKLIIHSAAYTDVVKAEKEKNKCFRTNVLGTFNLLKRFPEIPFVYISSEYVFNPVNYYSETKLAGEVIVKALSEKYLIIRTLFKPNPFPWSRAFVDQYTQGDYVDVIAPFIANAIFSWNKKDSKTIYVGTGRKTIFELAKRTKNVKPMSVDYIKKVKLPKDYENSNSR